MFERLAADYLLKSLDRIERGSLELTLPDGRLHHFEGVQPGPRATMAITDWDVPAHLARRGDSGFAEAYRDGKLQTDDLEKLIMLSLANEAAMKTYVFGGKVAQIVNNLAYMLQRNNLKGSRKNIQAHYDLGNEFYRLWLDRTMTYSSAIFASPEQALADAQTGKYDRMIDRLGSRSGSILEIGCGWGGFAEQAMNRGDYAVKGITLSDEQHAYAAKRLGNKAEIALEDYRHQTGTFDHIVSIEMFEAVGEKYWPTYFGRLAGMLKKSGRAVIQTITIEDSIFERYRRSTDFIRDFIFPGGMLPSPSRFEQEAQKAGLRVNDRFEFGQDYATTLDRWLAAFDAKLPEVRDLGYDEGFIRLWRFYLAACIAGFRTGRTNVMQVELQHA